MSEADPALVGTPTGNTSPGLTSAAVVLFIWSALTYSWRTWVKTRFRKAEHFGVDDWAISLSFLFIIAHLVTVCYAISHGYGNAWSELESTDQVDIEKSLFAGQIMYIWSMGLTRLSTSFFTTRLSRDQRYKPLAYVLTGVCLFWTAGSTLAYSIRGNLKEPWTSLDGSQVVFVRWVIIETTGMVLDLVLCFVSCFLIWALHMPVLKRLSVSAVFFCRLLVIPIIIARLVKLHPSQNIDPDEPDKWAMVLTEASLEIAFVLASVTCLKAFLRPFGAGYLVSQSDTAPTSGYRSRAKGSKANAYYMLSGAREKQQQDKSATVIGTTECPDAHPPHELATIPRAVVARGKGTHRAQVIPQATRSHSNSSSESKQQMIISQTNTWTVEYEDDDHDARRPDTVARAI